MRILFALPGLHRCDRGAEIAFLSIAEELAASGEEVTLIGSGPKRDGAPYAYLHAPSVDRSRFEKFPKIPFLRHEYAWEELTFAPALLARYRPGDYDVTVTCSYPFTNWILRRPAMGAAKPRHVFVTQNGDWPPQQSGAEFRYFGCDGLVCTNPDYFERNKARWNCSLIPNGVDIRRFCPGPPQREVFGLPEGKTIVLMVSALIDSKRIDAGIAAVSRMPDAHLVVAGAGPLRQQLVDRAAQALRGRLTLLTVPAARMADLYRSADVFLHLSLEEAFGNVFIEALACGLPVVGHDTPRLRWIVGEEGFLADTQDPSALTGAIVEAANAAPRRREFRVGRAALFSWTRVGAMYREFLHDIVVRSPAAEGAALAPQQR